MRVDVDRVLQGHSPIHPSIRLYVKLSVCLHGYCSCVYMHFVIECLLDYLSVKCVLVYQMLSGVNLILDIQSLVVR